MTTFKPISFQPAMVRAIRGGGKTQTRRLVKPQPPEGWYPASWGDVHRTVNGEPVEPVSARDIIGWGPSNADGSVALKCPYSPGDVLYVRETWADGIGGPIYRADWGEPDADNYPPHPDATWLSESQQACGADVCKHEWKPSIHMPAWACRLWLRVTDVRVQRVQEISEEDATAEGMKPRPPEPYDCFDDPREQFAFLWDSIHGPGAWERNDWVFAYTFKQIDKPDGWDAYLAALAERRRKAVG